MSTINTELVWYPPAFPEQGRLPTQASLVGQNCRQQLSLERAYRNALCLAAGRRVLPPCCKTLHISLFFDGTGNNLHNDVHLSVPKYPSNIARLFRATVGAGSAGGVPNSAGLFDHDDGLYGSYFKYYIPGVGTPFPEINDVDYSMTGLAFGAMGEDRINWGLLRIIDALKRVLAPQYSDASRLSDGESRKALKKMATPWGFPGALGSHNRREEFTRQLETLTNALRPALQQPSPARPKLLGIKLYIYGFSRGAAAARTLVTWLSELLPEPTKENPKPEQCLMVDDLKIPVSVAFLGLLDTVASVGIAHIAPVAEGHMSWAAGTQSLPDETLYGGLIKRCVHFVSSHEQRLCFPLDSIRRPDGRYPANSTEVMYPGVHSDIGGGYPPGDQGKGNYYDNSDSQLMSQIVLHDMYSSAFSAGCPLKVPAGSLPDSLKKDRWRQLTLEVLKEYSIHPTLIDRFNAWREVTLNLSPSGTVCSAEQAVDYHPLRAPVSLEQAVENQVAWLTAWRINRYAHLTLLKTPFYGRAKNSDGTPAELEASKTRRALKQGAVEHRRRQAMAQQPADKMAELVLEPGVKHFDPDIARTQLYEAAREFGEDYRGQFRHISSTMQLVLDVIPQHAIFLINTDDEPREYARMKVQGQSRVAVLFPPQGEESNAEMATGRVRALFDDQLHDSRAWFMHYALGGREPWGSYFRYRMIYFGHHCNKSLSLLTIAGNVVGAATLVGGAIFSFKQKGTAAKLAGLAGTAGIFTLETKALNYLTGEAIAMDENAEQLKAFTQEPGMIAAQQIVSMDERRLALVKSFLKSDQLNSMFSIIATSEQGK